MFLTLLDTEFLNLFFFLLEIPLLPSKSSWKAVVGLSARLWWMRLEQPGVAESPGVCAAAGRRQVELQLQMFRGRESRLCSKHLAVIKACIEIFWCSAICLQQENSSSRWSRCQAPSSPSSWCCVHTPAHTCAWIYQLFLGVYVYSTYLPHFWTKKMQLW